MCHTRIINESINLTQLDTHKNKAKEQSFGANIYDKRNNQKNGEKGSDLRTVLVIIKYNIFPLFESTGFYSF